VEPLRGLVEEDVGAITKAEDGKLGVLVEIVRQAVVRQRLPELAAVSWKLTLATRGYNAEHLLLLGDLVKVDVVHREALGADAAPFELVRPNLQHFQRTIYSMGGSVAEWLACWTRVQKGLGSNRSRDAVG